MSVLIATQHFHTTASKVVSRASARALRPAGCLGRVFANAGGVGVDPPGRPFLRLRSWSLYLSQRLSRLRWRLEPYLADKNMKFCRRKLKVEVIFWTPFSGCNCQMPAGSIS